jgi:hypothetical protein
MATIEAIKTIWIEEQNVVQEVEFGSIPATYEHLQISLTAKSDRGYIVDPIDVTINSDTTASNYMMIQLAASNTSKSGYNSGGGTEYLGGYMAGDGITGGSGATTQMNTTIRYGVYEMTIYNYKNTNKHTSILCNNGANVNYGHIYQTGMTWDNSAAVTTIKLEPRNGTYFMRGSMFTLYGIKSS